MRIRLAILASLILLLGFPVGASAQPATTYHGVFGPDAVIRACPTGVADPATADLPLPAWGNWNLTVSPIRAEVHVTVFSDFGNGKIHVDSFGGVASGPTQVVPPLAGETFHVRIPVDRAFGNQVDFVLVGDRFAFTITPYFDCASATTWGSIR